MVVDVVVFPVLTANVETVVGSALSETYGHLSTNSLQQEGHDSPGVAHLSFPDSVL